MVSKAQRSAQGLPGKVHCARLHPMQGSSTGPPRSCAAGPPGFSRAAGPVLLDLLGSAFGLHAPHATQQHRTSEGLNSGAFILKSDIWTLGSARSPRPVRGSPLCTARVGYTTREEAPGTVHPTLHFLLHFPPSGVYQYPLPAHWLS